MSLRRVALFKVRGLAARPEPRRGVLAAVSRAAAACAVPVELELEFSVAGAASALRWRSQRRGRDDEVPVWRELFEKDLDVPEDYSHDAPDAVSLINSSVRLGGCLWRDVFFTKKSFEEAKANLSPRGPYIYIYI